MFKNKIYKIVYDKGTYSTGLTLLVTAKDPVRALKGFYRIVGTNVVNISEFVEVIPKKEVGNIEAS